MDIIPAIDLIDGKCVRLSQGDYSRRTVYNEDPLEVARMFQDHGIKRLHLVDLDGAKASHIVNHRVLERLATHTSLVIDFGGGLKTDEDLKVAFESGAAMVTGGSIAVKSPDVFKRWLSLYGPERIMLGADVKEGCIAVTGWTEATELKLEPFLESYIREGVSKVICTDISKDGMLQGPAVELYKTVLQQHSSLYLVASGGVGSLQDLEKLADAGLPAAIVGKAIYEGRIPLKELARFLA
jgi:phosphoribosylformimino-5-aminoimidazole carboxamide ribotide isomerase